MKKSQRYKTSHLVEDQFEPGSRGRVLKNLLHITRRRELDVVEVEKYALAIPVLMDMFSKTHCFTANDICRMHKTWLGDVYEWAGRYRQVNITKDGFPFAAAAQLPKMMQEFEKGLLRKYTPCLFAKDDDLITALSVVHGELMLIHPFREGNGRVGRLLTVLMALQAGLPGLDFAGISGKMRKAYFAAVQASASQDYEPMKKVFSAVLLRTRRTLGK
ncbi:MAG: Fic family protein [Nitrospirae bacterium]|nr:Fic family protein [Nitrospirota bacterium]